MALRIDAAVALLHRAFEWWVGELRGMLPARVRSLFAGAGPGLTVDVAGDIISIRTAAAGEELGRLDIAGLPADVRQARLASLITTAEVRASKDALVRLPAARVLHKRIDLPIAAAENLREVLSFDIDRQTPFNADQVYFDYELRETDRKEGRLFVEFVAAPRDLVDRAAAIVGEMGLVPRRVAVAWPDGQGPAVNLLPRSRAPSGPKFLRTLTVALTTLALGLAIIAVAVPLRQREAIAEDLAERVAEQRKRAEVVRKLETQMEQMTTQGRFIVDRRARRPLAVEVLDELTRVVPDDTWLFRLRTAGHDVQIFGYSASATALIGLIEQAALFEDAQFRAPLTRDARTDAERLHIGFRFSDRTES